MNTKATSNKTLRVIVKILATSRWRVMQQHYVTYKKRTRRTSVRWSGMLPTRIHHIGKATWTLPASLRQKRTRDSAVRSAWAHRLQEQHCPGPLLPNEGLLLLLIRAPQLPAELRFQETCITVPRPSLPSLLPLHRAFTSVILPANVCTSDSICVRHLLCYEEEIRMYGFSWPGACYGLNAYVPSNLIY